MNIVLIDDDIDDREIFKEAVSSLGFEAEFTEAEDGQQALQKLGSLINPPPDIIFLDLNMPRMSGVEFLSHFIKLGGYSNIPVILLSTNPVLKDVDVKISRRILKFMRKESSISALGSALRPVLASNA